MRKKRDNGLCLRLTASEDNKAENESQAREYKRLEEHNGQERMRDD